MEMEKGDSATPTIVLRAACRAFGLVAGVQIQSSTR
jgi:hypothetical protein